VKSLVNVWNDENKKLGLALLVANPNPNPYPNRDSPIQSFH